MRLLASLGGGVLAVGLILGGVLWWNRGAHVELKGGILKVRTQAMEETSTVVVVDFRFANTSDYPFVARTVEVILEDDKGKEHTGRTVSEVDARRIFKYYPLLGQKFNDSLVLRDRVPARASMDRMIAASFELPQGRVDKRRRLRVRIVEVDGGVSEMVEGAP